MNLISQRPKAWSEVVGQDRTVALLKALLTTGRFVPRGFILHGPKGTGKTSVAYLLARALMCSGDAPLGCGQCPSCQAIYKDGIEHDPDFYETDAASKPGVTDARELMDCMSQPPTTGRRRVAVIDEAHRLSKEAWDVFLKPLEEPDTVSVFLFVTTKEDSIPETIQTRAASLPFLLVPEDTTAGFLASFASRNGIEYELEALKSIARHAKGSLRAAVTSLGLAAACGKVTKENAALALNDSLEDVCRRALLAVATGDRAAAAGLADEAGRMAPPMRVVEAMFALYSRSPWAEPGTELASVFAGLPAVRETASVFLRWLAAGLLPADALPLLAYELLGTARSAAPRPPGPKASAAIAAVASAKAILGEVI